MKTYKYDGPLSGVSLKEHGDVMLIPGATVTLPEDNEYTGRLIRRGYLHIIETVVVTDEEVEKGNEKHKGRK